MPARRPLPGALPLLAVAALTLSFLCAPALAAAAPRSSAPLRHQTHHALRAGTAELHYDVWRRGPINRSAPAVILIHGGGWAYDRRDAAPYRRLASQLTATGAVVFSIDYRLACGRDDVPATIRGSFGGTFCGYDMQDAIDDVEALVRIIRQRSFHHFDRRNITLLGASAGGHLAVTAAIRGRLPVRDVISLGGQVSFAHLDDPDPLGQLSSSRHAARRAIGCDLHECHDRWEQVFPDTLLPAAEPLPFRIMLVASTRDPRRSFRGWHHFGRAAARTVNGRNVTYVRVSGNCHTWACLHRSAIAKHGYHRRFTPAGHARTVIIERVLRR